MEYFSLPAASAKSGRAAKGIPDPIVMGDLVFIALASDNTRCGGSFVILGNLPFCAHWARIRASYLLVQIALLDVKTNMFGHLGKFILQFGQVQFAIWTNTFYSMYIVQEYKIYCREIYPDYLVPLDVPTFVAIPRLYFCCHSKISQDYISPTEQQQRPSYEDGKQSFYSILSSHHWEMGWHQLSITTHFCRISLII